MAAPRLPRSVPGLADGPTGGGTDDVEPPGRSARAPGAAPLPTTRGDARARGGRLPRDPLLPAGLVLCASIAVASLGAPLLAPYDPDEQLDLVGGAHRPPLTRLAAVELADGRWLLADRVRRTATGLAVERRGASIEVAASEVGNLTPHGVADQRFFLLGSDRFGRDLLSRLLHGGRVSLAVGLLAAALAASLGIAVGGAAGAAGGAVDLALMRAVDAALAFPRLFLLLAVAILFSGGPLLVIAILGLTGWMGPSRLVRAEVRALRDRDFVLAARGVGLRPLAVLRRHVLPNAVPPLLVDATLRAGDLILLEAALSFLGLGVQPPTASWGSLIADGSSVLSTAWWVSAFPGAAIALTVIAFNLVGDGLRERLDPRRRRASGRC